MLIIPNEGELFPEWRIMFVICYPGEDNYYKIEISPDDIESIKSAERWVIIDNQHFNKDMCESFRFITEIKDGNTWKLYSKELADELLKKELEAEMKNQLTSNQAMNLLSMGNGVSSVLVGISSNITCESINDTLERLSSQKNKNKTGNI